MTPSNLIAGLVDRWLFWRFERQRRRIRENSLRIRKGLRGTKQRIVSFKIWKD